ncbi:MAG: DUF3256 family protein [bacterium]
MMNRIIVIILFLFSGSVFCQNIIDYFILVPDSVCILNQSERKQLVENYHKGRNEYFQEGAYKFLFDVFDTKNGYLKIIGPFEGSWEMCYWNLKNENKLIAVNEIGCGPICDSRLTFFEYSQNKLRGLPYNSIMPPIDYTDCYDMEKIKKNNSAKHFEALKEQLYPAWTYSLPQKGKNIIVNFELVEDFDAGKYKIFYRSTSNQLELIWNDGQFLKGDYIK